MSEIKHSIILEGIEYKNFETKIPQEKNEEKNNEPLKPVLETELGQVTKDINKDEVEGDLGQSSIDTRANLHPIEGRSVLAVDALKGFKVLPKEVLALSRQKKRLSISIEGLGRKQIVEMTVGKRDLDARIGLGQRLKEGLFGGNRQQ